MTVERNGLTGILSHAFLIVVGATMMIPFLWMALTSLKSENEVFQSHILPREVTLGREGEPLRDLKGQPILDATTRQPIKITLGNPVLAGSPGDPARDAAGNVLYDDKGLPILIKNVTNFGGVACNKTKNAPVMRIGSLAEPNAAKSFLLTAELKQLWQGKSAQPDSLKDERGEIIRRANGLPYAFKECSWDKVGEPVLDLRTPLPILDKDRKTIAFHPAFPVLRGDRDALTDAAGNELRGIFHGETTARVIYGSDVSKASRVRFMWSNYTTVLRDPDIKFSLYAWNSLFVAVIVMILQVITSSMAGFAFARLEWPGRDRVFLLYLATMMIPGVVTMLPNYVILRELGWLDSFKALTIPAAFTAFGTFMMRQFMLSLPKSLEEAAMIDGASLWKVFWQIIMPLSKPAVITLAIFTFMGTWQSFTWPLIVTHAEETRVLPVALKYFDNSQGTNFSLLMAGSVLMMIPMVILFIFGQRFFVRGIILGAVKG